MFHPDDQFSRDTGDDAGRDDALRHAGRPTGPSASRGAGTSAAGASAAAALGTLPPMPDSPITVLLVDDDDDCRMLIRDAIGECDVQNNVVEVGDGQQAIEYLRKSVQEGHKPGLIFLDVEMPRMNGLDALRKIKADPHLKDIPVVMLTGVADEEYMRRAAEYGANSYTIKPADAELFISTVLTSATYWLRVHQYPERHLPQGLSRR